MLISPNFYSKREFGWSIVIMLAAVPTVLWAIMLPLDQRFTDNYTILTSLGQVTGLVGTAMYAISLIIGARLRIFDTLFGGLNKAYFAHHVTGSIALILLVIHPIVLGGRLLSISLSAAFATIVPRLGSINFLDYAWVINYGIIALAAMCLLLIITLWRFLPYDLWLTTHKFLGWFFFFGALHSFLIPSDVSQYSPLLIYIIAIVMLGMLAFAYRTLFGKILVRKYRYIVQDIQHLNGDVTQVKMNPTTQRMEYRPGQFVFISFDQEGMGESHPFTISSDPRDPQLSITVKGLGDFTKHLGDVKVGTVATVEGSYGKFLYQNFDNPNQIWIAGGIGITPFLGMAENIGGGERQIDLYYCVKRESEMIKQDKLEQLQLRQGGKFRLIPVVADKDGIISAQLVEKNSGNLKGKEIFLCGPPVMMKSLRAQFRKLGVPNRVIHSEEFTIF